MSHDRPPIRGAIAGSVMLAAILLCSAVGLGAGLLVGAPLALALVGLGAGFASGIALVRAHFSDL